MIRTILLVSLLLFLGLGAIPAQEEKPEIETRAYELKRASLAGGSPFAESNIPFPEGTSAEFDSRTGLLTVVHYESRFVDIEMFLDLLVSSVEPLRTPAAQLHIIHERIEIDHFVFADWLLENTMSHDGTELRKKAQDWARDGLATILDTTAVTCRSGQRAKTRSGEDYIFPTEPGVPEIPNRLELSGAVESPIAPRAASAFETRYLGVVFEVDPVIGSDEVTIDLNLSPYFCELEKLDHIQSRPAKNQSAVDMPRFFTERITTQVTLLDGHYAFLGTTRPHKASDPKRKNPLILNFVRADVAKLSGWKRVK